jgi:hypothetical protein
MNKYTVIMGLLLASQIASAQCPANPPLTLCNATLVTGSSPASPVTAVIGLPGSNPQLPPAAINSIITDTAFSTAGVRILRVTAPGFDNRNSGAATNTTYEATSNSHYLDWSIDDSTFFLQDQTSTTYVMQFNKNTFQATKIPCSFDPSTGNIGQFGNCASIAGDGSGQKYLIFNTGGSPYASNISGVSNSPYSYVTANEFYGIEYSDATGVKIYEFNLAPTLANPATPPTVLNSGNPIVDPWASCLPSGTSTSLQAISMKVDLSDTWVVAQLGTSLGATFGIYYNKSTGHCYAFSDAFVWYIDKVSQGGLVFYESDGVTTWGSSPTGNGPMHSAEISQNGFYGLLVQPNTWDNDGTHCNADCVFDWVVGTNKVITPDRDDGHGAVQSTNFTKLRVTSGGQEDIDMFPLSAPSLANRTILLTFVGNVDGHLDANPMTSAQTQYNCGVTFDGDYTNNTTPGQAETISQVMATEVFCYNNAGSFWRVAHSHSGALASTNFSGAQSYNNVSRDGKYIVFGSEWDGLLGNTSGGTCTTWSTCRTDVFIVELSNPASGAGASGGTVMKGGAVITN